MKIQFVSLDQAQSPKELLKGKAPKNQDPVIKESTVFKDKDSGETVLIYMSGEETKFANEFLMDSLSSVKFSKNKRTNGLVTQSEIIGYRPRLTGSQGKKTCAKTSFGNRYQKIEDELYKVAQVAEKMYKEYAPKTQKRHSELSERVHNDYRMPETSFTSGIINKNNPLKYHYDTGNFKNVFSIMLGLKRKSWGGYLHIPQLHINLEISNGSISMFDGQSLVHGVTPIVGDSEDNYRFTIVFYSLVQMWNCLETSKEVEMAKVKEDEKLYRLLERAKK